MTIKEAFDLYRQEVILDKDQAWKTEEGHLCAMKTLVGFFGRRSIESLTVKDVRDWKVSMEVQGKAPNTRRGYVVKLRVVLKYLRREGHYCLDPEKIEIPKRTKGTIRFLSARQVKTLINACDFVRSKHINRARNKAIIALLFSTGLRVSELCRVDIAHTRTSYFSIRTKGGENEVFFIDDNARQYIDAYLEMRKDHNPALFVSDLNKQRIGPDTVQIVFRVLRELTGLNAWPHTLRHSFGTDLMENKADIRRVQELMHHKNIQTTAEYLHFLDGTLGEMHETYHSKI